MTSPAPAPTPTLEDVTSRVMPAWSRYRGQPIDNNGRHSLTISGAPLAENATSATIDFFRHDGRYWRAVVPLDGVAQVFGQAYNFSPPKTRKGKSGPETRYHKSGLPKRKIPILNHVQSRVTFHPDQPVRLYELGGDTAGEPAAVVHDLVYSIEATGPPGVLYNLRDAIFGNLVCAHRFLSTEEMVFERIAVEGQYVLESPALALEPAEKRALLVKSLERSHRAGMDEPYYLIRCCGTNNCTSTPFRILDDVVNYTTLEWLGAQFYRLPINPRLYLRLRGLDPNPGEYKFLREEFEEYLNAPATRKRRREHVRQAIQVRRAARDAG